MNDVERIAMQADEVSHLVNQLSDAVQVLAMNISGDNITVLIPQGIEAMDHTLRQAAMVLSTLGMASSARTQGFDFDPTPTVEGSDKLIALAQEYANKLCLLSEEFVMPENTERAAPRHNLIRRLCSCGYNLEPRIYKGDVHWVCPNQWADVEHNGPQHNDGP